MAFCDHEGRFIFEILFENAKLREWFAETKYEEYGRDILTDKERRDAVGPVDIDITMKTRRQEADLADKAEKERWTRERYEAERKNIISKLSDESTKETIKAYKDAIKKKLAEKGTWDSEELRAVVGIIDGYHIMAHYLYYKNDPIWKTMVDMYKDVLDKYSSPTYSKNRKTYSYSPGGTVGKEVDYWLDAAWEEAEAKNDRQFKEFYYAVCAAKYIEGHIKKTLEWMKEGAVGGLIESIEKEVKDKEQLDKLKKIAKELKIALEIPDARSPEYAGLYLICRVKQIYAAVKTIREQLDTDRLFMLMDFEHIATQGFDPIDELRDFVKLAPEAGKFIISVHVTKPTPLHHHIQVEIGDIDVYKLLWELRTAGLGKHHTTYLIFERG